MGSHHELAFTKVDTGRERASEPARIA